MRERTFQPLTKMRSPEFFWHGQSKVGIQESLDFHGFETRFDQEWIHSLGLYQRAQTDDPDLGAPMDQEHNRHVPRYLSTNGRNLLSYETEANQYCQEAPVKEPLLLSEAFEPVSNSDYYEQRDCLRIE